MKFDLQSVSNAQNYAPTITPTVGPISMISMFGLCNNKKKDKLGQKDTSHTYIYIFK